LRPAKLHLRAGVQRKLRAIRKNEGHEPAGGSGSTSSLQRLAIPVRQYDKSLEVRRDEKDPSLRLSAQIFFQLPALVSMMEVLHRLFEADGNHQPQHDGGDVNEEVAPRGGGVVGRVDVEHGCGFLAR
jgi:hypothetical protein